MAVKASGWKLAYDPAAVVDHYAAVRDEARHYVEVKALQDEQSFRDFSYNDIVSIWPALNGVRRAAFVCWSVLVGTRVPGAGAGDPVYAAAGRGFVEEMKGGAAGEVYGVSGAAVCVRSGARRGAAGEDGRRRRGRGFPGGERSHEEEDEGAGGVLAADEPGAEGGDEDGEDGQVDG